MAISLFTGLPGAGKSLSLVDELRRMHKKEPGRPVYAFGIDGLKEGLAEPCDPRRWEDLPDGSIVVVDEAQKVWPSRRAGDPPDHVRAFSEHRHRGFDFLIATQDPKFIDSYLRGLIGGSGGSHVHVVRRWGGSTVDRYVWQEGQEDVKSRTVRALAQRRRWKFPRECFDMYKSSTMHTVKRRMPWQYWLMTGAVVLAVPMIWYAVHRIVGLRHLAKDSGVAPTSALSDRSDLMPGLSKEHRWATVDDYVHDHLPRVANQPWSAPVFDQEPIRAQPDLLCIENEVPAQGDKPAWKKCSCYTEQVTPYELHSLEECRRYAEHGVYNPRRAPLGGGDVARRDREDEPTRSSKAGSAAPAAGPAAAGAWQPEWRTRAYVQPERTSANGGPHALTSYSGGD